MNTRDIKKQKYEEDKSKNRVLKHYGKYPKSVLSNQLLRCIRYDDFEVLKDDLYCNIESWHDYENAGICKKAIELRKSFFFDIEKCQKIEDAYDVIFVLADSILNGVDNVIVQKFFGG